MAGTGYLTVSLKRNILANYVGQFYTSIIAIVMVPVYVKYMGAEAYGLVGFYAMLQSMFMLLDMGLTPTMARETARYKGGALDGLGFRQVFRALEMVFVVVALVGGLMMFVLADWLASHWLNVERLPSSEVTKALQLIALIIAFRWMCGLFRGVISGSEKLVWLSAFNAGIATLRFVLILPVLMFVSATPWAFFSFQMVVAILELVGLSLFAYRLLPPVPAGQRILWGWKSLKPRLKFSLTIAFTASVWVLVTQTDKLVLSKILSLGDYGYFTVAVLVASGISIMSGPISGAIMPRMTRLHAEGRDEQLISVYRQATQLVTGIATPIALMLALFSEQVLWAWTGNEALVEKAAPVLTLYAAGYGILAVSAFPYYLQYAKGELKLHLIGSILFVSLLVPSLILVTVSYGMVGAGWVWVGVNLAYFLLWVPLVHLRIAQGLHCPWFGDVISISAPASVCAWLMHYFVSWEGGRLEIIVQLCILSSVLLIVVCLSSSDVRKLFVNRYRMCIGKMFRKWSSGK